MSFGGGMAGGTAGGLSLRAWTPPQRDSALARASRHLADVDLVVDLGRAIGTPRWWLGLATLAMLAAGTCGLASLTPRLQSRPIAALGPAQAELARPQAISPLAFGAATGQPAVAGPRAVPLAEAPERPRVELSARLGRSGFEGALRRAGVGKDDLAAVAALVRSAANVGALGGDTSLDLVLGRRESRAVPRPLESLGFRSAFDMRLAVSRNAAGDLELKQIPIAVDDTPLRIAGAVGGNLGKAARAAGLPADLAAEAVRQLGYAVDFQHGIGRRDRFEIIVEHKHAETGDERFGGLLYAALDPVDKDKVELARFDYGGKPAFFRANGESARKGLMRTPVDGAHLTSNFGMRFHPILNYSRMHQGVDFGADWGSPVMAAAGGRVSFAGAHGGHGNYIMLQHNKELATAYAHLSKFAVKPGQSVAQGQVIGYVGSTGLSTGPHLHYEVWLRGQPTNPQAIKFLGGTQLAGAEMARFRSVLDRLRGLAGGDRVAEASAETRARRRG